MFECSLVSQIWQNSPFASYIEDSPKDSVIAMLLWMKSQLDPNDFLSFVALAWAAWSYRNSVVFNEAWSNVEVGAVGFLRLVSDYGKYVAAVLKRGGIGDPCVSRSSWIPPGEGVFRLNTDAAMLGDNVIGVGAVIRDSHGHVVMVAVRRFAAKWEPPMAEDMAARCGVQWARSMGFTNIELEVDALNLAKAVVRRKFGRSPLELMMEDICVLSDGFLSFNIFHVKRAGNCVAHFVARLVPMVGVEQVFVDDFPQGVLTLADIDIS